MITLDAPVRSKIERRARRAWRTKDKGRTKKTHRITQVTDIDLLYRLHSYRAGRYAGPKVTVVRADDGTITVPPTYGGAKVDLLTKADVEDLKNHEDGTTVRAYKQTRADGKGPHYPTITYEVGKTYEEKDANTDVSRDCSNGINVASRDWCNSPARLFAVEFDVADVAAIPTGTDGKLRVFKCKVIEELDPKTFKQIKSPPVTPQLPPQDDKKVKDTPAPPKPAPAPTKAAEVMPVESPAAPERAEDLLQDTETLLGRVRRWFKGK